MYEYMAETAEEELKRADHLVFVSLKYTRTGDVMKNAIKRMIVAFELVMLDFLEHKRKNKEIEEIPHTIKERTTLVKGILGSQGRKYLSLYKLLKEVDKAESHAVEEFRKNVTLKVNLSKPLDIKVDNLYEYLNITQEFVNFMRQKMK